jgi:tetratricopeptide (TPR) repeat protein
MPDERIEPDDPEHSALALRNAGREEEALTLFRTAYANDGSWQALFHIGVSLDRLGRYEEAMESFREALKIQPASTARYSLALVLQKVGRMDEAKGELEQIRDFPAAYHSLAEIALARGDYTDAEAWCRKALESLRDYPEVMLTLARVYRRAQRCDQSRALLERYVQLYPNELQGRIDLGEVLLELGFKAEARRHWLEVAHLADPEWEPDILAISVANRWLDSTDPTEAESVGEHHSNAYGRGAG